MEGTMGATGETVVMVASRLLPIVVFLLSVSLSPPGVTALREEVLWSATFEGVLHADLVPVKGEPNTALLVVRTPERWSLYEVKGSSVEHLTDLEVTAPGYTLITGAVRREDGLVLTAVVEDEGEGPPGRVVIVDVGKNAIESKEIVGAYLHAIPLSDGTVLALLYESSTYLEDENLHEHHVVLETIRPDGTVDASVSFDLYSVLPPSAVLTPGTVRIEPLDGGYAITGSGLVSLVVLRHVNESWKVEYYGVPNYGATVTRYIASSVVLDPETGLILARETDVDDPANGEWVVCRPVGGTGLGCPILEEVRRLNLALHTPWFPQVGTRVSVDGSTYIVLPALEPPSAEILVFGPGTVQTWEVPGFQRLVVTPRLYGLRVIENDDGSVTVELCAFEPDEGERWLKPLFEGRETGNTGGSGTVFPLTIVPIPPRRAGRRYRYGYHNDPRFGVGKDFSTLPR